jgi:hypothetical protein
VTPQEEQLLNSLVERVNQTQLREKDPDAEALLNKALGSSPDALYILAQTVLVQNIALDQAKAQLNQLQQQARQPAHATSFLGNLLGHRDPAPPPPPVQQQTAYVPPPPPPPGYVAGDYQPAGYALPQYAPAGPPSFLRGAMQTAAGVAAGALAFEGVEAVLHGLGGHPGYGWGGPGLGMGGFGMGPGMGMGMMGGGFERPVEETVINNNYYDQPGGGQGMERNDFAPGGSEHPFHESSLQSDQGGAQFTDASYNTSGDDQGVYDNGGLARDDSGSFDNSGADAGSGFDDGGGGSGGDLL